MTARNVLGAVLAGGRSLRMGSDKASIALGGATLVERALSALAPHCAETVVVSSRPDTPHGGARVVPDRRPACGPLGGIEAALTEARERSRDGVVILAVDLPLVDEDGVRALLEAWGGRSTPVAAAREGDPPFEPLCAVYPATALETAAALLDSGGRAARALFERLDGAVVAGVAGAATNVNEPADVARAQALLSREVPS